MGRYVQVLTPENVEVRYEVAGIGSRCIAALIDHSLQAAVILGVGVAVAYLSAGASLLSRALAGSIGLWAGALFALWAFVVMFGYHSYFEMRCGGQTPGKRRQGLRVVRDGGYPIDVYSSVVRNLVRLVDLMPPIYGAGLLSVFLSDGYKRLGDLAAGTLVIKEGRIGELGESALGPASPMVAHYLPMVGSTDAITVEEFRTIRRFVERRHELEIPVQAHIAMRIAIPILQRADLELPIAAQWHYADVLEAMARRYAQERGVL